MGISAKFPAQKEVHIRGDHAQDPSFATQIKTMNVRMYDESLDCTSEESFKSYSHCRPEPRQLQLLDEKKVNIYQDSPHGPELLSVFQPSISINPVQKIQDCSPAIAFNNSIAKLTQSLSRHSIRSVPTH